MDTARTVILAGGTGFIGSRVLAELRERRPDDRVLALAHSDSSADRLRAAGARPVPADMTRAGAWQDAVRSADAVIQAAQPTVSARRPGRAAGRRYQADRLAMDRHLLDAVHPPASGGPGPRLVYVAGNSYFGETGPDARAEETMTPRPTGFGPYITPAVEEVLRRQRAGADAVLVFPGAVYGDRAWLKEYTLDPLRAGKPVAELGGRSRVTSPVSVVDVARAVVHLLDVPAARLDGVGRLLFLVDDAPITFHEINEITAGALGATPTYRRVPGPLMRLFAGPIGYGYLTTDASYSNRRIKELGFSFRHPTARTGIPAVLSAGQSPAVGDAAQQTAPPGGGTP